MGLVSVRGTGMSHGGFRLGPCGTGAVKTERCIISYSVGHALTIKPRGPTPEYLPKRSESLCPHKT